MENAVESVASPGAVLQDRMALNLVRGTRDVAAPVGHRFHPYRRVDLSEAVKIFESSIAGRDSQPWGVVVPMEDDPRFCLYPPIWPGALARTGALRSEACYFVPSLLAWSCGWPLLGLACFCPGRSKVGTFPRVP